MRQVWLYTLLLLLGLAASQWLPGAIGPGYPVVGHGIRILTMIGLSFIMIRVGYEFHIDKTHLGQYGWDYFVAFTAAGFPWILVSFYFVFVLLPPEFATSLDAWKETLLAGRFAAPTSAGVLFSMLAAAGLGTTWLFKKARILAIFDDLDTVLLMIPLKMLMVGGSWQLALIVAVMAGMLVIGYRNIHSLRIPISWPFVLLYSVAIALSSEVLYQTSKWIDESIPIHIEVLLPAFVLGCMIAYPKTQGRGEAAGHPEIETPEEHRAGLIVAALFMVLVGLSMPLIVTGTDTSDAANLMAAGAPLSVSESARVGEMAGMGRITASQPPLSWPELVFHVLMVTLISNIGKMFPAFCYRREAHFRERLAVAVGLWPRGEVGAGVLVLSIGYGIGGPIVTVAMLSLTLNLLLTGLFILMVKRLTAPLPDY